MTIAWFGTILYVHILLKPAYMGIRELQISDCTCLPAGRDFRLKRKKGPPLEGVQ